MTNLHSLSQSTVSLADGGSPTSRRLPSHGDGGGLHPRPVHHSHYHLRFALAEDAGWMEAAACELRSVGRLDIVAGLEDAAQRTRNLLDSSLRVDAA